MDLDANAVARISELEEQIEDLHVIVDLQREEIADLKNSLQAAKGQIALLKMDRRATA